MTKKSVTDSVNKDEATTLSNENSVNDITLDSTNSVDEVTQNKNSITVKRTRKVHDKETCQCINCKYLRYSKLENELKELKKSTQELPSDKILYTLTENTIFLIKEKLPELKSNPEFNGLSYRDFINKLISISLQNYLELL